MLAPGLRYGRQQSGSLLSRGWAVCWIPPWASWGHQKLQGCYGCCADHVLSADLTRMIHILDTEHPWDVHSVNSEHSEAITCLEWDQSGEDRPGWSCLAEGDSDAHP